MQKKLFLLTLLFDILCVIITTIIMVRNDTINLVDNFDTKILLQFLIIFLPPSLIPALITSKIQKDSEKQFIVKQGILAIIILLFYFIVINFVLQPLK